MAKVFHLDDLEEFFGSDDWKLQINIVDIWNQFSNKQISAKDFNTKYNNRLLEYKDDIYNLGSDVWDNLQTILVKLNSETDETKFDSIYDNLYDWADKSDILIKTK